MLVGHGVWVGYGFSMGSNNNTPPPVEFTDDQQREMGIGPYTRYDFTPTVPELPDVPEPEMPELQPSPLATPALFSPQNRRPNDHTRQVNPARPPAVAQQVQQPGNAAMQGHQQGFQQQGQQQQGQQQQVFQPANLGRPTAFDTFANHHLGMGQIGSMKINGQVKNNVYTDGPFRGLTQMEARQKLTEQWLAWTHANGGQAEAY